MQLRLLAYAKSARHALVLCASIAFALVVKPVVAGNLTLLEDTPSVTAEANAGSRESTAFALASPTPDFAVDSTDDLDDADPGDGSCATLSGVCTLRAAIREVNALATAATTGTWTILLPANTYTLSKTASNAEDEAVSGDLDIDLPSAARVIVDAPGATIYANQIDRIFHVIGGTLELRSISLQNGLPYQTPRAGGCILVSGGRLELLYSNITYCDGMSQGGGIMVDTEGSAYLEASNLCYNDPGDNSYANNGGAIYSTGDLTIVGGTICRNDAEVGAGLYIGGGDALITDVSIWANATTADISGGGGLFVSGGDTVVTVRDSAISDNTVAGGGGGVELSSGTLTLDGCMLNGNSSVHSGGGLDVNSGTATVTHSLFYDNETQSFGGAIHNFGTVTLENSTVLANRGMGPAVRSSTNAVTSVRYSTIVDNIAGGVGVANSFGALSIEGTILAGSGYYTEPGCTTPGCDIMPYNCDSRAASDGNNLEAETTCSLGATGDRQGLDPMVSWMLSNDGGPTLTLPLLDGSPAIDAIVGDDCPDTDQRGYLRPADGDGNQTPICDVGAYEVDAVPAPGLALQHIAALLALIHLHRRLGTPPV